MNANLQPLLLVLLLLAAFNLQPSTTRAQGTAFTYQGQLFDNGAPANGNYAMQFKCYDSSNAPNNLVSQVLTLAPVVVSNGLFTVLLDFGPGEFSGASRWLQISAATNSGNPLYVPLTPRQLLSPTPCAIFAETASNLSGTLPAAQLSGTVPNANLSGSYSGAVTFGNSSNVFYGSGAGLTNVWQTTGNSGTTPGVNFLGTRDNEPLELHVNGGRGWQLVPTADSPNLIGGAPGNFVAVGVQGATIGGGGTINTYGFSYSNSIWAYHGTIGGGLGNTIQANAIESTIAGGNQNVIQNGANDTCIGGGFVNAVQTNASYSTIGGGVENTIQAGAFESTISGGAVNTIQTNAINSTIAGGGGNTVQAGAEASTISGGVHNIIQTGAIYATIAGGCSNSASGPGSFVGGGGTDGLNNYRNTAAGAASMIGGGFDNYISPAGTYAVIGGGSGNAIDSPDAVIGGGNTNNISNGSGSSFVGGGQLNSIVTASYNSTIGGGYNNAIASDTCTIAGGNGNAIMGGSYQSFIGGGDENVILPLNIIVTSAYATVCGGSQNAVLNAYGAVVGGVGNSASGVGSFVGGGLTNQAFGRSSTVPGGYYNSANGGFSFAAGVGCTANGDTSFALGNGATANEPRTFVWSDGSQAVVSQGTNSFTALATGGAFIFTGPGLSGAKLLPGSTSWTAVSDRHLKKNIAPVDYQAVLNKLAAIPIQQWNYQWEKDGDVPNIGPMAQDFKHAFYPGRDDKGISTLEFDGVELAAIEGLNQKVDVENAALRAENARLKHQLKAMQSEIASRLALLEKAVARIPENSHTTLATTTPTLEEK